MVVEPRKGARFVRRNYHYIFGFQQLNADILLKENHFKHILDLNLAMLLMSTSGALGRFIDMAPPVTIWWRCILAAIFLWVFCRWRKVDLSVNLSIDGKAFIVASILLGGHWITYFYALHLSNVAIGMLSLFTYPVFTALLEPMLLKTKFHPTHLWLGILALIGIYLLAPDLDLSNSHTRGIAFGLLSSLLYALRNLLLKKKVSRYNGSVLMFYQLAIVTLLLWPVLFIFDSLDITRQWPAVVTLALITTAIGHTLFVVGLKHFSVTTASIISSSQPIYGIIIGFIFLNEIPQWRTVLGGALILATVIIESTRSYKSTAKNP
ncbi:Permeases of the drug/metabolite transporter (DMT) superfamily [Fulvivirga imtechensis AK7]|uniref:Permeases of the drug/metabolite transporter (DMT) superfamily n=1 Tax=Fulvivirga imtechensis AK7 TaxID=1237149 RepID=L8JMD4_9BACT|nr:DMT family transporter [Fulvivirga imtechensis]ELR68552.1 Permeases of the drug/metabolite transporter (DMT) superfamily [Fulvivirga imtechensis AK7]